MTLTSLSLLVAVAALIVGTLTYRRIMTVAQRHRLQMAEKGEAFLGRTDVPQPLRKAVESMLDDAFPNGILFLAIAAILAPILIPLASSKANERMLALASTSREIRGMFLEIAALHRRIANANHPVLLPLLELEVSLIMTVEIVVRSVLGRTSDLSLDRDNMMLSMEDAQRHLRLAPARRAI
jgi:hypothetical protein